MTETEILTLIQADFRRRPALLCAYMALRLIAGDQPLITLGGGVRGWAASMGCSLGYPKTALNTLAEEGYITVAYGDARDVTITFLDRSVITTTDQSLIAPDDTAAPDPADAPAHQDAESLEVGSIIDRSPPTPPHMVHDSLEQQQQGATRFRLERDDQTDPALVAALRRHPTADPGLVARALAGRPGVSLPDFRRDVAAAEARRGVEYPEILVLSSYADGKGVGAPRRRTPARKARDELPAPELPFPPPAADDPLSPPPADDQAAALPGATAPDVPPAPPPEDWAALAPSLPALDEAQARFERLQRERRR